jgi:hypothetical protein
LRIFLIFQASWIRGYAANNSRALMRRRSSDALYVRMCLDTTAVSSSNSWCPNIMTACDSSNHIACQGEWEKADHGTGSATVRMRLDSELTTSQHASDVSPVKVNLVADDQPGEIYLPMDCGRRYSTGQREQI